MARIKDLVNCHSYDQTIYLMLMRLLGSPNNTMNFEYLASLLPWEKMIEIKNHYNLSSERWLQFFLHLSGLKPFKLNVKNKNDVVLFYKLINNTSPISYFNWQRSGQRPLNNPMYRLKILTHWLSVFPYNSFYFTLKEIITQRLSEDQLILKLNEVFSHDFSDQCKLGQTQISKKRPPHFGKPTIIEIIGNVILPFFYWEASKNLSFGFQKYLLEFYFVLPQLNQYAQLEKIKTSIAKDHLFGKKFYIYQGLLYLLQNFCRSGECENCPLNGSMKDIDKEI
jgi:hypothetical protein